MKPDSKQTKINYALSRLKAAVSDRKHSPVLVGSALGFAIAGTFNWPLFLLALIRA